MRIIMLLTVVAAGCGNRHTQEVEPRVADGAALPTGSRSEAPATTEAPPMPAAASTVRELLMARHNDDVPDRATLDAHAGALEALVWLASHGDPLVVRARALRVLGQYAEDDARAVQVAVASDSNAHPSLVAAAILGLGDRGFGSDADSRRVVESRSSDADPRIAEAAATALAAPPSMSP
jgi:hypothetical protein